MSATPAASFPGPDALGRGVVVEPGAPAPPGFEGATRLTVTPAVLQHPRVAAAVLYDHWLRRRRIVIELAVANAAAREPQTIETPPYDLSPDLDLHRERLHGLTWANTYDARGGTPIWWHGELARRRTGAHVPSGDGLPDGASAGDVVLPDGRAAWVDGGPRGPLRVPLTGDDALPLVHRESISLSRLTLPGSAAPPEAAHLAADQLAAVSHPSGPARVIAPAGSGKTRVLTARLRHLLADRGVEPELVTAVAYNTRAASELRDRTRDLGASIRTLHSLALWICNLDERRQVIDERAVRGILDHLVRPARIPNHDPFQPYLEALSEVRLALRPPAEVEAARGDVDGLTELFDAYRAELERRRALDFDEQVYRALELLLTRPDIRRRAQTRATHLLVDEFQDLTPAFLLLIRLITGPTTQVFAVGDDDQTIYSYAGATPRYLVDIDRWFAGAGHHALTVNYRCPPGVVDAVINLLSHNHTRIPKAIRSGWADDREHPPSSRDRKRRSAPADALAIHAVTAERMAELAVEVVSEHLSASGGTDQIAVLARVNSALLPVQIALTEAGIGHTAPLDSAVLRRTGVRTALAYLRLGLDLERIRREDLLDTLNRPARKIKSVVQPLLRSGRMSIDSLEQVADSLGSTHRDRFDDYLADLRYLEQEITAGARTVDCLRIIREHIGLGEAMDALDSSRRRPEGSSHADDLDSLLQLAALQPDPAAFQEWLTGRLRVPADPDGVTLSSVHRVKGMEWDRVVVFAANGGLFPHRLADDLEEERRVFHVALTRCRERVTVIADRDRPSPFLEELVRAAERSGTSVPRESDGTGTRAPGQHGADPAAAGDARVRRHADGTVTPAPGTRLDLVGGLSGRVERVDDEGIAVRLDPGSPDDPGVTLRLDHGDTVLVDELPTILARFRGATARRGGPGQSQDDLPVDERLFEALRGWRSRAAAETNAPAYLIFHDRHLRTIAARRPGSVRELAACPGVGPAKLERYADDVLDVIERFGRPA